MTLMDYDMMFWNRGQDIFWQFSQGIVAPKRDIMRALRGVKKRIIAIGIFHVVLLSGCSTAAYVIRLGFGQTKVFLCSRSNEAIFRDPSISQETKDRINFVLEVKQYAEERLGLKKTGNYSRYYKVNSQGLLYLISACPKDSLNPYQWNFPIVGRMSYKGFFSLREAEREKEKLEEAGFDTCLRGVRAYSTLGWFKDPIFSSMLNQNKVIIAQIVIHELTHTTVFIEDHLDFNEQMATFVGDQGAIDFFSERYGKYSPDYLDACNMRDDDLIFGKFIEGICSDLKLLYSRGLSRKKKLELREVIFREAKERFRDLLVKLKTPLYLSFEDEGLNNAVLLSYWQYVGRLGVFKGLYNSLGEDLGEMVAFLKDVKRSGEDPMEFVQRRLHGQNP
ncbi:MAG: aminopeptidase [Syntrophobacterales bacterium]|nr:MAG: aminopeptidase [Syntrophobacterales bacterium]